jgi:hypothetical protein
MTMTLPTIHTNGDTKDTLYKQCSDALEAVRMAVEACREMTPNGRNYYPQNGNALTTAMIEHCNRLVNLTTVQNELARMLEGIADGGHKSP